jgi:hypothetical protein
MQFSVALLSALYATAALAAPRGSTLAQRMASRRKTLPPQFIEPTKTDAIVSENNTQVSYSSNWAGAVIEAPPAGATFNAVSAQFVVPTPKVPSGGSSRTQYAASAWVGIDGDTYGNAILQTGVDFYVEGGSVSFDCWYEWYPDYAYTFTGISIKAGDTIALSVSSTSASAGTTTIKNLSSGQSVSKKLTAPSSNSHLGGQNAEWIVEDFEEGSGMVPFANFGTVTFTNAKYGASDGSTGGAGAATILDIKQGSSVLTSASASGNTVKVAYT